METSHWVPDILFPVCERKVIYKTQLFIVLISGILSRAIMFLNILCINILKVQLKFDSSVSVK